MKRDGQNRSLWQTVDMPDFFVENSSEKYDVIIAGAGITGLTLGYILQKAGKKCLIIEAENIGFGTTGGTTAHINTFFDAQYDTVIKDFGEDKAKLLAQVGPEVIAFMSETIMVEGIDCDFVTGMESYVFAVDEEQKKELEDFYDGCKTVGMPVEVTEHNPWPIPAEKVIKICGQAQFHPTRYLRALSQKFMELGGTILEGYKVQEVKEVDDVEVKTASSTFLATDFIWATHVVPNINRMNFLAAPYRSYAIAFTLKTGEYPLALGEDFYEHYHYFRIQKEGDETFVILGGEDHKTGQEDIPDARFAALEEYARKYFDVDEIAYHWSSQYYTPTDSLPFIGLSPGDHHIYWATGYDGNGMTFGTAAGLIISDLILTGDSKYKDLFDPSRMNVKAGFADTVKESADAVFHLIKDKFTPEKIHSLDEIKPGEGKTVFYDSKTMSIYRDASGTIYGVESACTHMGCNVSWNSAEATWDCPCHGARYNIQGEVLNGPATKNLKKIQL